MLTVYKAGGDALENASATRHSLWAVEKGGENVILACSAPRGVTPLLRKVSEEENPDKQRELFYQATDVYVRILEELLKERGTPSFALSRFLSMRDTTWKRIESDSKWWLHPLRWRSRKAYIISRGEAFEGFMLHIFTGWKLLNPIELIRFGWNGKLNHKETQARFQKLAKTGRMILPGFYVGSPFRSLELLEEGGTDITAAWASQFTEARRCVLLKKTQGIYQADPNVVEDAKALPHLSYQELRELSGGGARVVNTTAARILWQAGIVLEVKSFMNPGIPGTLIVPQETPRAPGRFIGVSASKGYTSIRVDKIFMHEEVGFILRMLKVFKKYGIPVEHVPGGIDTVTVVVKTQSVKGLLDQLKKEIADDCKADYVRSSSGTAMITVVAYGFDSLPWMKTRLFEAVEEAGISSGMTNHGPSDISIVLGVRDADTDKVVKAIHRAFANSHMYASG